MQKIDLSLLIHKHPDDLKYDKRFTLRRILGTGGKTMFKLSKIPLANLENKV